MKSIALTIIAICTTFTSFGQSLSQRSGEYNRGYGQSVSVLQFYPLPATSIMRLDYDNRIEMKYEGEHAIDKCSSYRKMKIAGIVLSAVGGAMILTGSIIRGAAYRSNNDGTISNVDYWRAMDGGGAMIGIGAVSLGAGIPLAIIGSVKTRRYCRGAAY